MHYNMHVDVHVVSKIAMTAPFSYIVSHMKKKKLRSTITIDPLVTGRPSDVSGSVYQGNTESKRSRGKVNAHPVPIT